MKSKVVIILMAAMLVISMVAAGCAPKAPAGEAPTPAPAGEVIKWVGQTHAEPSSPAYAMEKEACERIKVASGGRLEINLYSAGGIIPAETELDAADTGAIAFGLNCPGYWVTHFPAASLFTYVSGGMSPIEFLGWMETGGGTALMDKMVSGMNVHMLPGCGIMLTPEIFMSSSKEVTTLDDLQGLKMRAFGDGGEILARMGISMVHFPSVEIYESMQRGVIDAFDHTNPTGNWDGADQEVAHYVYLSGTRQPMEWQNAYVNQDEWDALPADLQLIVENEFKALVLKVYWYFVANDVESTQKFVDYGCQVEFLSDEIEDAYAIESAAFYAEAKSKDPLYAEVYDSMYAYQQAVRLAFPRL